MIAKTSILSNLRALSAMYVRSQNVKDGLFYSKLALLELCGWIEESMDGLVLSCTKCLLDNANAKLIKDDVVKRTYGFDYKLHFRVMLRSTIGIKNVERLERRLGSTVVDPFDAALQTLKVKRNAEAHTHLKGVTHVIDAPSVTIANFNTVYAGLVAYERAIKKLKL